MPRVGAPVSMPVSTLTPAALSDALHYATGLSALRLTDRLLIWLLIDEIKYHKRSDRIAGLSNIGRPGPFLSVSVSEITMPQAPR